MRRPCLRRVLLLAVVAGSLSVGRGPRLGAAPPTLEVEAPGNPQDVRLVISPGGRFLLSILDNGLARLWHVPTRLGLRDFEAGPEGLTSGAFSPRGRLLMAAQKDGRVTLSDPFDPTTAPEPLVDFPGAGPPVAVALGPAQAATTDGRTVAVIDRETKRIVRRIEAPALGLADGVTVEGVGFSPDGRRLLAWSTDQRALVLDPEAGAVSLTLTLARGDGGRPEPFPSASFSPDGLWIACRGARETAVFDARTGDRRGPFADPVAPGTSIVFLPAGDGPVGAFLAFGNRPGVEVRDLATGTVRRRFAEAAGRVASAALDGQGKTLAVVAPEATEPVIGLWDVANGTKLGELRRRGRLDSVQSITVTAKGLIQTGSAIWDEKSGRFFKRIRSLNLPAAGAAYLPEVLAQAFGPAAAEKAAADAPHLPDRTTFDSVVSHSATDLGISKSTVERIFKADFPLRMAPSDLFRKSVGPLIVRHDGIMSAYDRVKDELEPLHKLVDQLKAPVLSVAAGPAGGAGSSLAVVGLGSIQGGGEPGGTVLVDTATQAIVRRFEDQGRPVKLVLYSAKANRVLSVPDAGPVMLFNPAKRTKVGELVPSDPALAAGKVNTAAFGQDGRAVLLGYSDKAVLFRLDAERNAAANQKLLESGVGDVTAVAFDSDGTHALVSGTRGTAVWPVDGNGDQPLCRMFTFADGSWAVVDPDGRFDASHGGAVDDLKWNVGGRRIRLDQLKDQFFDPGLLAKLTGKSRQLKRKVPDISLLKPSPDVVVSRQEADLNRLDVRVTDQGGGIGRVVVKLNGKELPADALKATPEPDPEPGVSRLTLSLAEDPRLRPGQDNVVEVKAYDGQGEVASRGSRIVFVDDRPADTTPPQLWAVVVGISDYVGDQIDLRYPAKDAADFAHALSVASTRLLGSSDRVHIKTLISWPAAAGVTPPPGPNDLPNRENVLRALRDLQDKDKVKSKDLLVVYLSGHGINRDDEFYYLTTEAGTTDLDDATARDKASISAKAMGDLIRNIPANKDVMILDTCAAAKAFRDLTVAVAHAVAPPPVPLDEVPDSQARALERLQDRTGMHILAGAAANASSYEATRFAQGILTYTLLLGMQGGGLFERDQVDVFTLFNFAVNHTRDFALEILQDQLPRISSPEGTSFPIGMMTPDDVKQIRLETPRPILLRSNFHDTELDIDTLDLGSKLDGRLRDLSTPTPTRQVGFVFIDSGAIPGALQVGGRYRLDIDTVSVNFRVFRDKQALGDPQTVSGPKNDLKALVIDLGSKVEAIAKSLPPSPTPPQ